MFELVKNGKLTKEHLLDFDIFQERKDGMTLLHYAAEYNQESCAKLMLETRWLIATDKNGWLAIHYATFNKNLRLIKMLIDTKSEITIHKWTPIKIAETWNSKRAINLINRHTKKERNVQDVFPLSFLQI